MADTFDSRLKLRLQESGGNSGQWGDLLNQTITNVASVFGFGTHQLTADSDATLTLADDGASLDALKSSYLKITSSVSLTATRTLTFSPNTFNQVKYVENNTTGGQSITLSQGSGANITIENGATKIVYFDGAGSGAAVVDALAKIDFDNAAEFTTLKVTNIQANDGTASMTLSNSTGNATFSGNVGIGSVNPSVLLDLESTSPTIRFTDSDATGTPESEVSGAGGDLVLRADRDNEKSSSLITFEIDGSEHVRIDSSGNVGIGTTSPNVHGWTKALSIDGGSSASSALELNQNGTKVGALSLQGDQRLQVVNHTANPITFHTNGIANERMRLDSSGNLGLGLTPNTWAVGRALELGFEGNALWGNAADEVIVVQNGYYDGAWKYATTRKATHYSQYDGTHRWFYAPSGTADSAITWLTAMTIDNSGNLLVGVTGTTIPGVGNTTAGVSIRGDDGSFFSRSLGSGDTNNVVSINRSTADGNILGFAKDGTTVGSIATEGGDSLVIQGGSTSGSGLLFHPTGGNINPARNGAKIDDTIDLGRSTHRFKDLYLSGGVHLGGTGSANELDHYEEGLHTVTVSAGSGTPSIASSEDQVAYTVVGDSVFITGQLGTINCSGCSGALNISMPFTTKTNDERSDFYNMIAWVGISNIAYLFLSQSNGGSSTFLVQAIKTDGSYDGNVATLLASHGSFNLNIIGGHYKKA